MPMAARRGRITCRCRASIRLAGWIATEMGPETPWHVSRFFPAHRMTDVPPTPLETLRLAADIGREAGLAHVYVGNAPQLELEDTRCAGCGHSRRITRAYSPADPSSGARPAVSTAR